MNAKNNDICPICGAEVSHRNVDGKNDEIIVQCGACGKYAISREFYDDYIDQPASNINKDEIASYLYYHKGGKTISCLCEKKAAIVNYRSITIDEIRNWYPKTFHEKVDIFLLDLDARVGYMSEKIPFTDKQLASACFVNRDCNSDSFPTQTIINSQIDFFINFLVKQNYIEEEMSFVVTILTEPGEVGTRLFIMLPKGLERIDALQHNQVKTTKNVFIAMSFASGMEPVREAIKAAIRECGYIPRIMDEIEHNHQIVPEMLYEIREAKFVIAELTNHNNGAYFEAGYALGNGKELIQVCQKSRFGEDGHFDVKQVNTVLWDSTEELTEKLIARIRATIT